MFADNLAAMHAGPSGQFGTWLHSSCLLGAELLSKSNWDFLVVDLQHSICGFTEGVALVRATTSHGKPTLVRVSRLEPAEIGRVLDAGASGVICPMINSMGDAKTLVSACRYPPSGTRSFGPIRARLLWGDGYASQVPMGIAAFAMIETESGLREIADIARTPGLSGVFVGPNDLALALGAPPGFDPADGPVVAAIDRIARAAAEAGVLCGLACESPSYAQRMKACGYQFFVISSDLRMMVAKSQQTLAELRPQ